MEDKEGRAGYVSRTSNRPLWFVVGVTVMVMVSAIIANAMILKYILNKVTIYDYNQLKSLRFGAMLYRIVDSSYMLCERCRSVQSVTVMCVLINRLI